MASNLNAKMEAIHPRGDLDVRGVVRQRGRVGNNGDLNRSSSIARAKRSSFIFDGMTGRAACVR